MKKKIIGIFVCMLLIAVTLIPATNAVNFSEIDKQVGSSNKDDSWPQFQNNPQNVGYSPSTVPNTKNILWKYSEKNGGFMSPIVANGKVFVGTLGYKDADAKLICLDANTGDLSWEYTPAVNNPIYVTPAYYDGKVYFGTGNWDNLIFDETENLGDIFCLNAEDGSLIWQYDGTVYVEGAITITDGKVYVGVCIPDDGLMLCLDADTGDEIWSNEVNDYIRTPVGVGQGNVYFLSGRRIYCLDAVDGKTKWYQNTVGRALSSATVVGDKVYAGCQGYGHSPGPDDPGVMYCLNAETGEEFWNFQTSVNDFIDASSPAITDDKIVFGTTGRGLFVTGVRCIDKSDGSLIWSRPTFGRIVESPAIADGKIYIPSLRLYFGIFHCIDLSTGRTLWRHFEFGFYTWFSSPAIADGKVYVGLTKGIGMFNPNIDGILYCFG